MIMKKECNNCGFDNIKALEIHHKDRNHRNNNPNNLEIFCRNCHKLEHYEDDVKRIKAVRNKPSKMSLAEGIINKIVLKKDKAKAWEIVKIFLPNHKKFRK